MNVAPVEQTPGPSDYCAEPSVTKRAAPAFTISARLDQENSAGVGGLPAPGDYFHDSGPAASGPAFTIPAGKPPAKSGEQGPGPGEYSSFLPRAGPAFTVPQAVRDTPSKAKAGDEQPGPGEYSIPTPPAGPAFSMPQHEHTDKAEEEPGPGQYTVAAAGAGPAFSIAARAESKELGSSRVGPGAYDVPEGPAGPSFSISVRSLVSCKLNALSPACKASLLHTSHLVQVRRNAAERSTSSAMPGPASYNPAPLVSGGGAFTIPQADSSGAAADSTPGPGQYGEAVNDHGPAFTIPAAVDRAQSSDEPMPGPGEYHGMHKPVDTGSGPAMTIPKASTQDCKTLPTPGPGDYDHSASTREKGGFSMGGR